MKLVLTAEESGERLDVFLSRTVEGWTRAKAQKYIDDGLVTRNGRPGKKNDKLSAGDTVEVEYREAVEVDIKPVKMDLNFVYEDEDVVVIDKLNGLMYALGDKLSGINGELRPGIVHRIDKDTSGLLAVAKNDTAHIVLASQLADHTMARTYECIVCGNLKEDSGTVEGPIGRHPTDRKKMCINVRNGKDAVTHWEVIDRYRGYTHVRCKLETGRTHQIRVHMASIGHPILGDTVYGHKKPELGQSSQVLHAGQLCFQHPRDQRPVIVLAPLPPYFVEVLEKLKKMN